MNKIHILCHQHSGNAKLNRYYYGQVDAKLIGAFYSQEKAQQVMEEYHVLPGFCSDPEGFNIHEYIIDEYRESSLIALFRDEKLVESLKRNLQQRTRSYTQNKKIYYLYFSDELDNGYEISELLGVFSSKERARRAHRVLVKHPALQKWKKYFTINQGRENHLGWREGFS